ncbi:hypothetical protein AA103196_2410 [Ameyamaea chiangmaiensis NBRC 103196]|nr:hypothetical protein AA103196_2410 [Ameyamaea chiangmaiensis NBRC 103196]
MPAGKEGKVNKQGSAIMSNDEFETKLARFDHLIHDDDAPMEPSVLWRLLSELAALDAMGGLDERRAR